MRIALLPYAPVDRPNGVNRYINSLTSELAEADVVSPRSSPGATRRAMRRSSPLRRARDHTPPQLDGYDIVHVPYERIDARASLRDRTVVATVMGLGGLSGANPDPSARRLDSLFIEAMQRLDEVAFITPSDATRQVLCDLIGVEPSSVTVIPLGVDHRVFGPIEPSAQSPPARPTSRPYLLHVGPYSMRKNSRLLLESFAASRRHDSIPHALVWAGPVDPKLLLADASRLNLTDHVVITGRLSDEELADAYRGATALCVPSRYEGFGLPVLEAMACGTPVIISDSPALVEVAADAAIVAGTTSGPSDLAAAISNIVGSEVTRRELGSRGLTQAAPFTWAACAHLHRELYLRVAGHCGNGSGRYSPRPP